MTPSESREGVSGGEVTDEWIRENFRKFVKGEAISAGDSDEIAAYCIAIARTFHNLGPDPTNKNGEQIFERVRLATTKDKP